jgi:hypothetical protein
LIIDSGGNDGQVNNPSTVNQPDGTTTVALLRAPA